MKEELNYIVVTNEGTEEVPQAAFRYPEDAEHWRDAHCPNARIVYTGKPLPTIEEMQGIYTQTARIQEKAVQEACEGLKG